jgi:hypothetical protein
MTIDVVDLNNFIALIEQFNSEMTILEVHTDKLNMNETIRKQNPN